MPRLVFESVIQCSPEKLWEFHQSAKALEVLTPPHKKVALIGDDLAVRNGNIHKIKVKQFGIWLEWHAEISSVEPPTKFVDTALKSPFKKWEHTHEFLINPDGSLLRDSIEIEMPFGPLGLFVFKLLVEPDVRQMFAYRHEQTKKALEV